MQRVKLEQGRQQRIFDPKIRTIGVDRQKLDEQVLEKKRMLILNQEREDWQDRAAIQQDKHMAYLENECRAITLQKEKDLVEYRNRYQRPQVRREWELNDPNALKKDFPARQGDNDPRCGPSSLQKFSGEDLDAPNRRKRQTDQLNDWVKEQIDQNNMKKKLEQEEDRIWAARQEEISKRAWDIEQLAKAQKKQALLTTVEFNKQMAEQQKQAKKRAKEDESRQSLNELQNMLDSDILSERAPPHEKHKGLSKTEIQQIQCQQANQRNELRQRLIKAEEDRLIEEARYEHERSMALMLDKKVQIEKKDAQVQLDKERKEQAAAQRSKKEATQRLYANEIGEQFFDAFQKTSR
eukprot:TRINITY_DN20818_c0_g1_i1.p1 TRINITY_DN20818_c0_g1~~TRINITY_DN20818_c0_g1_i1.p1  ORF type:complete len:374 (+),score=102.65 TRINITY_DN20818_c0_g1_i1:67-1122(+)